VVWEVLATLGLDLTTQGLTAVMIDLVELNEGVIGPTELLLDDRSIDHDGIRQESSVPCPSR
jgi:hypothetical protein